MKPPTYTPPGNMLATRSRLGLPPLNRRRRHGLLSTRVTVAAIVIGHALLGALAWWIHR